MTANAMVIQPAQGRYSDKAEYTVDLWLQGYSCSECIVLAFADQFDLDPDIASRISSGFGFAAGLGKEKTCGVITGAIMVVGLKYGSGLARDEYARDQCMLAVQEFFDRFLICRQSTVCTNIHLTYGQMHTKNVAVRNLTGKKAFCAGVTRDAASILEKVLKMDFF